MTVRYKQCCKPQLNARFEMGELTEVWQQHFCAGGRRDYKDPATFVPKVTRVEPREAVEDRRPRRDAFRGSMHSPTNNPADTGIRGKRTFKSEPRSRTNRPR